MKTKDEVCNFCPLLNTCKSKELCAPLLWIDGNLKRKEPLIRDLSKTSGEFEYSNYNDALAELITDKEQKSEAAIRKIKEIFLIQDCRVRSIRAMQFFNIPNKDIWELLNISKSLFYDIIK